MENRIDDVAPARRTAPGDPALQVRESDLEPYVGLGYLSRLFRFIAIFLVILLVAEVATGIITQGRTAIPTLLAEASRLMVMAGLLWGAGDLALLCIDIGHDVRATRILLGRQTAHEDGAPFDPVTTAGNVMARHGMQGGNGGTMVGPPPGNTRGVMPTRSHVEL